MADLDAASATLHDARFTLDAICFDASAKTFTLKCWQLEGHKKPRRWRAWSLSFAGVIECDMDTKESVAYYELATIRFDDREHALHLVTHYGVDIRLLTAGLDGILLEASETRASW
jgi:hypothetical protein